MNTNVSVAGCTRQRRGAYGSRRGLQPALILAVCGSALLASGTVSPVGRSGRVDSTDISTACSEWDAKAVEALAHNNIRGREAGTAHARTAPLWLAEARRSCADGLDARAQYLYRRIVEWRTQA